MKNIDYDEFYSNLINIWKTGGDGTRRAVDEFAKKNNLKLEFLYKKDGKKNYPIYKFVKN